MNVKALGYKDIGLISRQISTIKHRVDVDTGIEFCGKVLQIPIIASPMPDVGNHQLLNALIDLGGYGYIHRFQTIEQQVSEYVKSHDAGCAIGATGDYKERFIELHDNGCRHFCIDTANGAHEQVSAAAYDLFQIYEDSNVQFIVGNVATKETFQRASGFYKVCGVRVGIAGGSVCTTKTETGLYYPMVSSIRECVIAKRGHDAIQHVNIIADGGIKEPADMCKALAVGANIVMLGSVLGSCLESPAKTVKLDGQLYKVFRGSASYSTQMDNGKEPFYIEGEERLLPYSGPLKKTVQRFVNGLRSSMSYMNARNLWEYRKNSNWCIL
jgi:IMP dehydrogenase/GMP reductase